MSCGVMAANYAPRQQQQQQLNQSNPQQQEQPQQIKQQGPLSDSDLASKIRESLQNGDTNYNDNITVRVEKGRVFLEGKVANIEDIEFIEDKLNGLDENITYENRIEISPDKVPNARWHQRDFEALDKTPK